MYKKDTSYKVLKMISDYIKLNLMAPSIIEVSEACDFKHHSTAAHHINKLFMHGMISKTPNRSRSIKITAKGIRALREAK